MKNPIFQTDPKSSRVGRGGSWGYLAQGLRVSYRYGSALTSAVSGLGFRIFRTKEKS